MWYLNRYFKKKGGLKIEQINVFLNILQPFCPAKDEFRNVQEYVQNIKKNIKKKLFSILNRTSIKSAQVKISTADFI